MLRIYSKYYYLNALLFDYARNFRVFTAVVLLFLNVFILIQSYAPAAIYSSIPINSQPSPRQSFITLSFAANHAIRLPVQIINGQKYCSVQALASSFPSGRANETKCEITYKTERLRLAPSSFFIALESSGCENRIAQMNMPVITINGKALVPVPQFYLGLQTLGLFAVKATENRIALTMLGQNLTTAPINHTPDIIPEANADDAQPGRYTLPANLNRIGISAIPPEPNSELNSAIAVAESKTKQSNAAIIALSAYRKDSVTQIRFTANSDISSFQKPEIEGNEIIIRFNELDNATRELGNLSEVFPIQSARVEKFRQYLVFRIRLSTSPISCSARRVGTKKVALEFIVPSAKDARTNLIPSVKPTATADNWKLDVVVLDPGHGGADEGATSITGAKEKDIALSIALMTRDYLKKTLPSLKVVLTRSTDTFIALDRRGQIANEAGGKLFISIHCNSMPSKPHPAHGFETYILRPGRNPEAIAVAERENAAVKFEKKGKSEPLSEEQIIVATMAQAAFVKLSEKFASIMQEEMKKNVGLSPRGVSQAGFLVLVGASMPNILFESAFLSNESDEKYITHASGQTKIAEAIAKAVRKYSQEYAEVVKK